MNISLFLILLVFLIWGLVILIVYSEDIWNRFANIKERYYDKQKQYCCNCYHQGNDGVRTFCLLNQEIVEKYSRTEAEFRYIDCKDSYCGKKCKWKVRGARWVTF